MSSQGTFTILGCGNSAGVPAIGGHWGTCDPANPKNKRTRCCASLQTQQGSLIIDTGPDFKEQYQASGIGYLDAILYTHHHGDHVNGIDELRTLYRRRIGEGLRTERQPINLYGSKETLDDLQARFAYMFGETKDKDFYPSVFRIHPIEYGLETSIYGTDIRFVPFEQNHGTCNATGYRFGNIGYTTDMFSLDETALDILKGVDIWITDSAGYLSDTNPVHANLERIYEYQEIIKAKEVYLTAMPPNMDYEMVLAETPDNFYPAYDGLSL